MTDIYVELSSSPLHYFTSNFVTSASAERMMFHLTEYRIDANEDTF